jgi:hypothetical protein
MKYLLLIVFMFAVTGCEKRTADEPQRTPGALLPGGDVHYGGR